MQGGSTSAAQERKDYETARLRLARMSATGGDELARPVAEACKIAANTLPVERVGIWLFVDSARAIRCFHLFERSGNAHSEGALLREADIPTYFRALREQRCISADDARTNPLTCELRQHYLDPLGITSMLDAPIYFAGDVRGVVCHEHVGPPRTWSNEDRDFAASVADRLSLLGEEAARRDAERRALVLGEHALELEKMKAVAQLAAGAAHDFRSVISVVRWMARSIAEDTSATTPIAENASRILAVSESAMNVARDLEMVGRESQSALEVVSAALELDRLEPMLRAAAGSGCDLALRTGLNSGLLLIDRAQLERLVLNLVVNARDAMPAGGTILVEVGEATVEDHANEIPPGVFTVISVTDSGTGMSPEVRRRAFEPFFTTKNREAGTGLGLTVVHSVAERFGGFVHVESEPGRGTTFRVYLPRVAIGN